MYRDIIKPLLFRMDPEQAHYLAHKFIAQGTPVLAALNKKLIYTADNLRINLFGQTLSNPIGLAAGFDKNGDLVHALKYLGFGFAEIGSITAQSHGGNPKPRLWRLPDDQSLINWMGLNGEGAVQIAEKLASSKFSLPVGINIAKTNKPHIAGNAIWEDMLFSFRAVRYLPVLYVVINVSCVNTHAGILEETDMLSILLEKMKEENSSKLPILLKLSEDANDELIDKMIELGKKFAIAGYICGNTSRQRPPLKTNAQIIESIKNGGLSGPPIKQLVLPLTRKVYKLKEDTQIVISNGGISNGQDAYDYIRAGSSAVQIYTSLVYEGPSVVHKISKELSALLKRDGLMLQQAIGADSIS